MKFTPNLRKNISTPGSSPEMKNLQKQNMKKKHIYVNYSGKLQSFEVTWKTKLFLHVWCPCKNISSINFHIGVGFSSQMVCYFYNLQVRFPCSGHVFLCTLVFHLIKEAIDRAMVDDAGTVLVDWVWSRSYLILFIETAWKILNIISCTNDSSDINPIIENFDITIIHKCNHSLRIQSRNWHEG